MGLPKFVEAFLSAKAAVGVTFLDQPLDFALMDFQTLALTVGPVVASAVRTLVPLQAQPFQGIDDGLLGFFGGALAVGILDAQNHASPMPLGKGQIEQGHVSGPDVGIAGGRWSDARTDGLAHVKEIR